MCDCLCHLQCDNFPWQPFKFHALVRELKTTVDAQPKQAEHNRGNMIIPNLQDVLIYHLVTIQKFCEKMPFFVLFAYFSFFCECLLNCTGERRQIDQKWSIFHTTRRACIGASVHDIPIFFEYSMISQFSRYFFYWWEIIATTIRVTLQPQRNQSKSNVNTSISHKLSDCSIL